MSFKEYHSRQLSLSGVAGFADLHEELTHLDPPKLFKKIEEMLEPPYCDEIIKELMMLYEQGKAGNLDASNRYHELKGNLHISDICSGSGTSSLSDGSLVTINRLRVMFPHFCNLEQLNTNGTLPTVERLHGILRNPEFGGIIPTRRVVKVVKEAVLDKIERLHLYCLARANPLLVPLHQFALYKLRNEKSLLSDMQRVIMLKNYGILSNDSDKLTSEMEEAFGQVKEWWPPADLFWPPAGFYEE